MVLQLPCVAAQWCILGVVSLGVAEGQHGDESILSSKLLMLSMPFPQDWCMPEVLVSIQSLIQAQYLTFSLILLTSIIKMDQICYHKI